MINSAPDRESVVGEAVYDVSQGHIRYALSAHCRTAVFDFRFDSFGGAATGTLAIFIGENTGSLPWAHVKAGDLLQKPLTVTGMGTVITIVPVGNCSGLLHITTLPRLLGAIVTH